MSAESNMVNPASRHRSTSRFAPAASVSPHVLKNSVPPPKVPVPKLNAGTLSPERPSCRNSIVCPRHLQSDPERSPGLIAVGPGLRPVDHDQHILRGVDIGQPLVAGG